ncbi:MAG: amino acid permease [Acidobacteria bacterium]|nr:MAG: amino acid permease [Acidobacteriota bacterium]
MELPRRLGLFSTIAVVVGSTIGSGIFRSPAGIAARIPDEGLFLAAWIVGGICVLAGALTYAELAGSLPQTGGVFVYLREGFGRMPAFLFGWAELTIIRASALGAIATVFAEYLLRMLGVSASESSNAVHYVAAASILLVATFNFVGIHIGALVQNLTTSTKYLALFVLVLASLLLGGNSTTEPAAAAASGPTSLSLFGLALISILWVYDGWADVTFVSGEVRRPERYLPLALILGTLCVIAIYLAANFAYVRVLSVGEIANSQLVAADVAQRLVGNAGLTLVSLVVMISAFGTLNGSMMTGPRIFFAMADEGLFFKGIAAVHPRFKTPYVAIWLAALMAAAFVMLRDFQQLSDTFILGIWPFYAGAVAAVYALRRKRPSLARPYRVWGYPVTPAIFLAAAFFLLGNALLTDRKALVVFAVLLTGIPAYWIWERTTRKNVEPMTGR